VPGTSPTGSIGVGSEATAGAGGRAVPQGAIQAFPSGTVSFDDGGTPLGSFVLNNGSASLVTTFSTPGTHMIGASYSGDANTAAASITLVQVVNAPAAIEPEPAPALSRWLLILLAAAFVATARVREMRRMR